MSKENSIGLNMRSLISSSVTAGNTKSIVVAFMKDETCWILDATIVCEVVRCSVTVTLLLAVNVVLLCNRALTFLTLCDTNVLLDAMDSATVIC